MAFSRVERYRQKYYHLSKPVMYRTISGNFTVTFILKTLLAVISVIWLIIIEQLYRRKGGIIRYMENYGTNNRICNCHINHC